MPMTVICPACGKLNRVHDNAAVGETILCLGCGGRVRIEADELPTPTGTTPSAHAESVPVADSTPVEHDDDDDDDDDATEVQFSATGESSFAGASAPPQRHARTSAAKRPSRGMRVAVVTGAVCLLLGGLIGVMAGHLGWFDRGNVVGPEEMAELSRMKGEAEQLALDGKLEAAHAKYRELEQRLVGRKIKDSLFWDILERTKIDKDRIYTILLDKAQSQYPPDKVMPTPGPGKAIRKDDPWYYRVANQPYVPSSGPTAGATSTGPAPANAPGERVAAAPESPQPAPEPSAAPAPSTVPEPATAPPASEPENAAAAGASPPEQAGVAEATPPAAASQQVASTTTQPTTNPVASSAAEAPVPARWVTANEVTDDDIGFALKRGVEFLLANIKDDQIIPMDDISGAGYYGRNALVVYALLEAGGATNDPRLKPKGEFMGRLIDKMKSHRLERGPGPLGPPVTYARSLRATALAFANRPQDRDTLRADADWLIRAAVGGAYTYDDRFGSLSGMLDPDLIGGEWGSQGENCHGLHDREHPWIELGGSGPTRFNGPVKPSQPPKPGQPPTQGPAGATPPTQGARGPSAPQGMGMPRFRQPGPPPPPVPPPPSPGDFGSMIWDNSNSQYGLLGVWAASEVGVEVPRKYWEAVQHHWESCQLKSGEWGYRANDTTGRLAMTAGGIASLSVTYDWLVAPVTHGDVGRDPMTASLAAAMKWLENADHGVQTPHSQTVSFGYDLFAIERVGLATGFKYLGSHDWYRELAAKSLAWQSPDGSWSIYPKASDNLVETAYHILFLSHGRHPLLMNKLRFERGQGETIAGKPMPAYWANRPRDVANLARFTSRELERGFNWQVVDLNREWHDWLDCPVLFIASHNPPGLTDADYAKLRQFCEAGGIIFTHADGGSKSFTKWAVEELAHKVFPEYPPNILPQDHWIYSLNWEMRKPRPQLWGVTNGSRLLIVHSPTDLNAAWQQRDDRGRQDLFRLGTHVFFYAAGKLDFHNRIDSPYVPPAPEGKQPAIPVARVKYDGGDWDPEPGAWRRFANLYQWEMDTSIPVKALAFEELDAKKTPCAHLTGIRPVEFSDAQAKALNRYVAAGGIILVDPCGGSKEFDASVRALLVKAFPKGVRKNVPPTDPLFQTADGSAPFKLRLRPWDVDKLKMSAPPPLEYIAVNEGVVIISHVDITTGLLGTNTLTVVGYDPSIAQAVVWNMLGWTQAQRAARGDVKLVQ
jgi:hypothetical protein